MESYLAHSGLTRFAGISLLNSPVLGSRQTRTLQASLGPGPSRMVSLRFGTLLFWTQ